MRGPFIDPPDCSRHEIFPGVTIRTAWGERMMLSLVSFEPHAVVEPHSHPHEQMGMLLEGEMELTVGGQTRRLTPGQMWSIPGGVVHSAVAGDRPVKALDVFCPVRDDYK
jgi:quercetin dioxygenase-like cupin family protein